jgi:hypothetical protein
VLKRTCAPGGGWPKEAVEIIRSRVEGVVDYWWERHALVVLFGMRRRSPKNVMSLRCVQGRHDLMHEVATRGCLVLSPVNAKQS